MSRLFTNAEVILSVNNIPLLASTTIGGIIIGFFIGIMFGVLFTTKLLQRRSRRQNQVNIDHVGTSGPVYEEINLNLTEKLEVSHNVAYDSAQKSTLS